MIVYPLSADVGIHNLYIQVSVNGIVFDQSILFQITVTEFCLTQPLSISNPNIILNQAYTLKDPIYTISIPAFTLNTVHVDCNPVVTY